MASLSDVITANNAAVTTSQEFDELLDADFALLNATQELLRTVRDMKRDARLRIEVAQLVIDFKEELAPMMEKYGVELVPSALYVQSMDLRVVGTDTRAGQLACQANMITTIPPNPVSQADAMQAVMQEAKNLSNQACGIRANPGTPFKPGCI